MPPSVFSKVLEHKHKLLVAIIVIAFLFAIHSALDEEISRDRNCKRSLEVIKETIQRDPDALTEEGKAYVRYLAKAAVDTFCPQPPISTKRILSMDEYVERLATQERIQSIRERLDRQSGQ